MTAPLAEHTGPSGTARVHLRPDPVAGDFYAITLELDPGVIARTATTLARAMEIFADLAALADERDREKPARRGRVKPWRQ